MLIEGYTYVFKKTKIIVKQKIVAKRMLMFAPEAFLISFCGQMATLEILNGLEVCVEKNKCLNSGKKEKKC